MVKRIWNFSGMDELNSEVNSCLRTTMFNERCRRWEKVIAGYKHILWMIDRKKLPDDYEPPTTYQMFIYEILYHLGVAYQHVGKHKQAIQEYTNAIDTVSIPKNGCLAGCLTNSCLMTPLYARRSFAHAKSGNLAASMKDAEKAVVLDSKNPDVYCIRALVYSSKNNDKYAIKDLDLALQLNPTHNCTLMLHKAMTQPQIVKQGVDPNSYMNVASFLHPCMIDFFDKMLFGLSVPHTITQVDLTPDKPSKKSMENELLNRSDESRPSSGTRSQPEPFRCGTPVTSEQNRSSLRRRKDYGAALQKYLSRPKTATDFFAHLENERKRKIIQENIKKRAASVHTEKSDKPSSKSTLRKSRVPEATKTTSFSPEINCAANMEKKHNDKSKQDFSMLTKKPFVMKMPTSYTIPVFQATNINDAPRMYYRPWKGDKLPVAELIKRKPSPAFY